MKPASFQHLSTNLFGGLDEVEEGQLDTYTIPAKPIFLTLADRKRPRNALHAKSLNLDYYMPPNVC